MFKKIRDYLSLLAIPLALSGSACSPKYIMDPEECLKALGERNVIKSSSINSLKKETETLMKELFYGPYYYQPCLRVLLNEVADDLTIEVLEDLANNSKVSLFKRWNASAVLNRINKGRYLEDNFLMIRDRSYLIKEINQRLNQVEHTSPLLHFPDGPEEFNIYDLNKIYLLLNEFQKEDSLKQIGELVKIDLQRGMFYVNGVKKKR